MKHIFIGVGSGLAAGLALLLVLFNGPWSLDASPNVAPTQTQTAQPEATLEAQPSPTESATETAEPEVVQCSVSELEDAEDILDLQAQVVNASTGEVLFDRGSATPMSRFLELELVSTLSMTMLPTSQILQIRFPDGAQLRLSVRLFLTAQSMVRQTGSIKVSGTSADSPTATCPRFRLCRWMATGTTLRPRTLPAPRTQ